MSALFVCHTLIWRKVIYRFLRAMLSGPKKRLDGKKVSGDHAQRAMAASVLVTLSRTRLCRRLVAFLGPLRRKALLLAAVQLLCEPFPPVLMHLSMVQLLILKAVPSKSKLGLLLLNMVSTAIMVVMYNEFPQHVDSNYLSFCKDIALNGEAKPIFGKPCLKFGRGPYSTDDEDHAGPPQHVENNHRSHPQTMLETGCRRYLASWWKMAIFWGVFHMMYPMYRTRQLPTFNQFSRCLKAATASSLCGLSCWLSGQLRIPAWPYLSTFLRSFGPPLLGHAGWWFILDDATFSYGINFVATQSWMSMLHLLSSQLTGSSRKGQAVSGRVLMDVGAVSLATMSALLFPLLHGPPAIVSPLTRCL